MILVRDIIQRKEATVLSRKYGFPEGRALTDLTGNYYTFVMASTQENLAAWESSMSNPAGADEWGKWYQRFAPLLDGGHREILSVVE